MSNQIKKELAVAALQNGIVIDHIPSDCLFKVVDILGIEKLDNAVTIGFNFSSRSMGKKGLIKIADVDLPKATLNRIAVIAPNAVINVIRDYAVVEKHKVELPEDLYDIVRCTNPKCISNNEPMATHFHVIGENAGSLKCHYCERIISREEVVLK